MLDILSNMDTYSIQTLVPHPLLLHLEQASLAHTCIMQQQDPPDQLHSLLLQIMALVLLEL